MEIIEAKVSDLPEIEQLADWVWEPTYRHIVLQQHIVMMKNNMHTRQAYLQQMENGHRFFLAKNGDVLKGFVSIVFYEKYLYISKLYVHPQYHGSGCGWKLLNFVKALCQSKGLQFVELNVNRYNKALYFYRRNDFYIHQSVDIPYGPYWLMDYVLRWIAPNQ